MKKKNSDDSRHVVAWINKAEWDQVLEYLYSKDPVLQKFAVHRISAWKGRYASSTPVAVECTADLVRCQVLDRSGHLDADDLSMLYGMALVRFVNLITERHQGKCARPLRMLAGKLNIPEWIIDLRHDFTHRKRPTLNWCRKGCKVVLEWLQQEYWSRQLASGLDDNWDSQSDGEDGEEELKRQEEELVTRQKYIESYKKARELLISYEIEQFQTFDRLPEEKQKSLWPPPSADLSWVLAQIKHFALESGEALIDVMNDNGFLIPTAEQLESLHCAVPEVEAVSDAPRLPQVFLRFWLPLLKALNSPAFVHSLLEKLFAELQQLSGEPDRRRAFYLSAWISEVINCNSNKSEYHFETKAQRQARVQDRMFVNRIQLRWQQLLSACLEAPCAATPHLLQLILDDMEHPLPLDTRQKLLRLCSIYTQNNPPAAAAPEPRQQPVYTLESLHRKLQPSRRQGAAPPSAGGRSRLDPERTQDLQQERAGGPDVQAAQVQQQLQGSPWQLCSDAVPWKSYPLGKVPGQSEDPTCLMVDNYSTMTVFDQPVDMESAGAHNSNAPGVPVPLRTATDGPLWTHGDVGKLKSGLRLF